MRVAVLGVGAIGGLVAARLAKAGAELLLCARGEMAQALSAVGMLLEKPDGRTVALSPDRWHVAETSENEVEARWQGWADVVILAGKATSAGALSRLADQILTADGIAFSLSNGLGHAERLVGYLGRNRVLGASTTHGAIRLGPGEVRWAAPGKIDIGVLQKSELSLDDARVAELIQLLDDADLSPAWSEEIERTIWTKLLLNVAINPVCAICGIPNGGMLERPDLFEAGLAAMEEAARVAVAEGVDLSTLDLAETLTDLLRSTAPNRCSMLQDVMAGRATEIESICGEVIRRGEEFGIPTPRNQTLAALVHGIGHAMRSA